MREFAWRTLALVLIASLFGALATGRPELFAQAQEAKGTPTLRIEGDVARPLDLSVEAISKLPHKTIRVKGADGNDVEYGGVPLFELIQSAGFKFGQDLRGPALSNYLVVEAADGYKAVFALPELDPAWTDRVIMLCDCRDGQPLDAKEGPLRVIVPDEKRHGRWVKRVIVLKVGKA